MAQFGNAWYVVKSLFVSLLWRIICCTTTEIKKKKIYRHIIIDCYSSESISIYVALTLLLWCAALCNDHVIKIW